MKRKASWLVVVVCFSILMVGCNKDDKSLIDKEVSRSTILVLEDGITQSAIVEDFQKEYYKESELKDFINQKIQEYTKKAGEDAVKLEELKVSKGVAKATFSYKSVKDYAIFNEEEVELLTTKEAEQNKYMPDNLVVAKDGTSIKQSEALSNTELKVLIIESPNYNVMVDGNILYYSNGLLINDTTVQSNPEGVTVVIYE